MNKRVEEALNKQLSAELYSSHLYLSMAAYLTAQNLNGFANWMKVQSEEERTHAMKFFDYIDDRDGRIEIGKLDEPKKEWNGIIDLFEEVLKHEKHVTSLINDVAAIAEEEKDRATINFLKFFIDEQVEEEATVGDLLDQLKLIDGNGTGLFMLDKEAKTRILNAN